MAYHWIGTSNLGSSKAAAAITAELTDLAGVAAGTQPAFTVTNKDGVVGVSTAAMPDGQEGYVWLKDGSTYLSALPVAPRESEGYADVQWILGDPDVASFFSGGASGAAVADALLAKVMRGGYSFEQLFLLTAGAIVAGKLLEGTGGRTTEIHLPGDDTKILGTTTNAAGQRTFAAGPDLAG
jgi:hypothetical protein